MTSILCQSSNNKHVCYCLRIATDNNLLCLAAYPCTASTSAVRLPTLTALYIYTNFPWKDYYTNRLIFCCLATTLQTSFILLLIVRIHNYDRTLDMTPSLQYVHFGCDASHASRHNLSTVAQFVTSLHFSQCNISLQAFLFHHSSNVILSAPCWWVFPFWKRHTLSVALHTGISFCCFLQRSLLLQCFWNTRLSCPSCRL